jgi:hypothetical protein
LAFDTFYFSGLIISLKRNFLFLSLHSLGLGERREERDGFEVQPIGMHKKET